MVQSYQGLITELINMLFTETGNLPWDDPKFEKRVRRLNLILILRLLIYLIPSQMPNINLKDILDHLI